MFSNIDLMRKTLLTSVIGLLCICTISANENQIEDEEEESIEKEEVITTPEKDDSYMGEIILSEDVEGIEKTPSKPTESFDTNAVIHAVVPVKNAPPNTTYKASWYVVDVGNAAAPNSLIDSVEIVTDSTRNIDFKLKPVTVWPIGTYRVDISVNGQVKASKTFTVK